jgi:hypothetical protein
MTFPAGSHRLLRLVTHGALWGGIVTATCSCGSKGETSSGTASTSSSGAGTSSSGGGGASSSSGSGASSSSGSGSSGSGAGGASSSTSSSGSTSTSTSSSTSSSSSSSSSSSGAALDPSVYQHHKNGTRDGLYVDPVFTQAAAATTHVTSFMGAVSAEVYAQPLYVEDGPGADETFVVATEGNDVIALNATTGAVIWDVGPSIIGTATGARLPGGTVGSKTVGITGTPFIDKASRTVFFDALTTPDNNATFHHKVFAVGLDTGTVLPSWPVDVSAVLNGNPAFDSGAQNQRGALQFLNGVLYVPYGGFDGDGGPYFGSVVGFPVATPQKPTWWHTTAAKGGIWGPGALPTDGTSIFPVTGNTSGTNGTWGGGEAVIRLGAGPTFSGKTADYYAPSNWLTLDNTDADLGGASEVLIDMPGEKFPHLVVAGGKDANLYVLNRDDLGGIGGELLKVKVATNQIKGAPAAYTTALGTYLALHIEGGTGTSCPQNTGGNLVVMKLAQSATGVTATTAWCSTENNLASPMVTTTDGSSQAIVWNASTKLYGWDGDTGAVIVDGTKTAMATAVQKWNTPIAAKGRIVVGVNGQLYVFTP